MKIEDMKFPIETVIKDDREYKVNFSRRFWFKQCCDLKCIQGDIESREIFSTIKGFKKKINPEWEDWDFFSLCPVCGEVKGIDSEMEYSDIIQKTWLKIIKNERRYSK